MNLPPEGFPDEYYPPRARKAVWKPDLRSLVLRLRRGARRGERFCRRPAICGLASIFPGGGQLLSGRWIPGLLISAGWLLSLGLFIRLYGSWGATVCLIGMVSLHMIGILAARFDWFGPVGISGRLGVSLLVWVMVFGGYHAAGRTIHARYPQLRITGNNYVQPFQEGDCVIFDARAYRSRLPGRGEIVLFRWHNSLGAGKISAGSGDLVGENLERTYADHRSELKLPEDAYGYLMEEIRQRKPFLLPGENYLVSNIWGNQVRNFIIARDGIVAKARLIYYPFSRRRWLP